MPSTIITKNGSGAPLAADLVAGELAVDLTNGRLYTDDGSSVIEIGLNPSGNVDVTGTVTADGLTVDGTPVRFVSTAPMLNFMESGVTDSNHRLRQNAGNFVIQKLSDDEGTATDRLLIDGGTGDISFYEDTGTTAKFFWDASAESLGIGSASPVGRLDVSGGADGTIGSITLAQGNTTSKVAKIYGTSVNTNEKGIRFNTFHYGDVDAVTITSNGNVGIGTSSPGSKLSVNGDILAPWVNTGTTSIGIERRPTNVFTTNTHELIIRGADGTTGAQAMGGGDVRIRGGEGLGTVGGSAGNVIIQGGQGINGTSSTTAGYISFETGEPAATERMRIDSSGDISIGDVSTEGAKLHIRTANSTTYNAASASGADGVNLIVHNDDPTANTTAGVILRTQVSGSFADARINNIGVSQNNSAMTFHTEGSGTVAERMRIDSDGNLLVGTTTSPAAGTPKSVRYGQGVQAGTISSATAVTASVATNVIDLADAVQSANVGTGIYLVTVVRDGGSFGTNFVGIVGVNTTVATIYAQLTATGMTVTTSGTNLEITPSTTDTYLTNVIPLSIDG